MGLAGRASSALRVGGRRAVSRARRFGSELWRRRVVHAAAWYTGGALASVEGIERVGPKLGVPAWFGDYLIYVAVLAFPTVMVLAWWLDVTQSGIRWAPPSPDSTGAGGAEPSATGAGIATMLVAFLFTTVGATVAWLEVRDPPVEARFEGGPPDPEHVAILSPDVSGASDGLDAFAQDLHERLIGGLRLIETLVVHSRRAVQPFSDPATPVDSIARALGVGTIVHPHISAFSDILEVRLSLMGESGDQLGESRFHAPRENLHALVKEAADSLVSLLRVELGPSITTRLRVLETESEAAHGLFVAAIEREADFDEFLHRGDLAAAGRALREADSLLALAAGLDEQWVEPVVRRGWLGERKEKLLDAMGRASLEASLRVIREGLRHADRASRRDKDHPHVLELRGSLRFRSWKIGRPASREEAERLVRDAEQDLRAALTDKRIGARALSWLSELQADTDRFAEALRTAERAYERDPYLENANKILSRLVEYSFERGNDSAAVRWVNEGLRRYRDDAAERVVFQDLRLLLLAWTDVQEPDPSEAWQLTTEILESYPQPLRPQLESRLRALVSVVLAKAGQADSAMSLLEEVRGRASTLPQVTILQEVAVLIAADRRQQATERLRQFLEANPAYREMMIPRRVLRQLLLDLGLAEPLESAAPK